MLASLKKRLATATAKWKKTPTASSSGSANEAIEDGNYDAIMTKASLVEQASKAAVIMEYTLQDEGVSGEVVQSRYWLETDKNLGFLKRDLGRFGVENADDIDLAEDLEGLLSQIVDAGPVCRISVKNDGEWQNVYLNKVVEMGGAVEEVEEEVEEVEEVEEEVVEEDAPPKCKACGDTGKNSKGGKCVCTTKKPTPAVKPKPKVEEVNDVEEEVVEEEVVEVEGFEIGDTVTFRDDTCEILATDDAKQTATVKTSAGKRFVNVPFAKMTKVVSEGEEVEEEVVEEEVVEEEEELAELKVGAKVIVNFQGKEQPGIVKELDEENEKVKVTLTALKKIVLVGIDKIELV